MLGREETSEDLQHVETRQQLADLAARVVELEARVARLEEERTEPDAPEACRNHTCDYYRKYLSHGPKELEHEGYHAAVERLTSLNAQADVYLALHGWGDEKSRDQLARIANLEKLVRV